MPTSATKFACLYFLTCDDPYSCRWRIGISTLNRTLLRWRGFHIPLLPRSGRKLPHPLSSDRAIVGRESVIKMTDDLFGAENIQRQWQLFSWRCETLRADMPQPQAWPWCLHLQTISAQYCLLFLRVVFQHHRSETCAHKSVSGIVDTSGLWRSRNLKVQIYSIKRGLPGIVFWVRWSEW